VFVIKQPIAGHIFVELADAGTVNQITLGTWDDVTNCSRIAFESVGIDDILEIDGHRHDVLLFSKQGHVRIHHHSRQIRRHHRVHRRTLRHHRRLCWWLTDACLRVGDVKAGALVCAQINTLLREHASNFSVLASTRLDSLCSWRRKQPPSLG
jgi:hypothetical protein